MEPAGTLIAATAVVLSLAGAAAAADQLVPGKRLRLSERSGRQRADFMAKDPVIVAPVRNGADDPTVVGATLVISNPDSEEGDSFALPASGWSANAAGTTYRFRNPAAPGGPSAVRTGQLRGGRLTLSARDTGITLDEPVQSSVGIVLIVGSTRYCAHFGGAVTRNQPGAFSAKDAVAPASCPGQRAGTSADVSIPSNVDGEAIAFTVHEPTSFLVGLRYPLILEGHGYGGNRVAASERPAPGGSSTFSRLLDAGYGIISVDQRGHGDSGGQIRILDPNFEGKDLIQMLDWAEANVPWLAYRNNNLLLGAIGGSYGGGYQHTIYSHDPLKRLDAITPEITWHDLRYSLFSGNVFKSFWATLLSLAGNATPGGQHQDVNDGLVEGLTNNNLTPTQLDLLKQTSLIAVCEAATLDPIDALYWQSTGDTLFSMNEAARNVACVDALGGDVRFLTKNGGHDSILGGASGEQCGDLDKTQSIVDWYDEKLKGVTGQASYIPQYCFHMDGSTNDGVVTPTLPIGGSTFPVTTTPIIALEASPQVLSLPLTTIGAGGAVLAGIPTIQLTVTDPLAQNLGDPILFIGLAKRPSGSGTDTLIAPNQVRPFRGYGAFNDELIGVATRFAQGDEVRLLVHASYSARYVGSASDVAALVDVGATVDLPLLPGNLPAPPAN